ncbi:sensor histidine kinase [Amycolatopsis thermophila]|uniref:histidine kinase n=1 Tax=Amycolatopsis thermophila TaxID=206084 RepID=A0ABU0F1Y6_9PSEU|nr:sensor histidine kinase [Amycolatopsis thermophila]MDQ0381536.1 signal transduction histidine kinase [Amycolatopsis thermophila]
MKPIRDRRTGRGRRRSDDEAEDLRALVHDIGHQVATMSYLVDAALSDEQPPDTVRRNLELLQREIDIVAKLISRAITPATGTESVEVRSMLETLVAEANVAGQVRVVLAGGPTATAEIDGWALWRILANILNNAVRAAGPGGVVTVTIIQVAPTVIEIEDDGPGFGAARPGWASLGLNTVRKLSQAVGAEVTFHGRDPVGTLVRVVLPTRTSSTPAQERQRRTT